MKDGLLDLHLFHASVALTLRVHIRMFLWPGCESAPLISPQCDYDALREHTKQNWHTEAFDSSARHIPLPVVDYYGIACHDLNTRRKYCYQQFKGHYRSVLLSLTNDRLSWDPRISHSSKRVFTTIYQHFRRTSKV